MISLRRLFSLTCVLVICLQFMIFPQGIVNAEASKETLPGDTVYIYLPMISNYHVLALKSPANGAQLNTLAPTLSWYEGSQPNNSHGCLAFGKTPNLTHCNMTFSTGYSDQWNYAIWFNLEPSTVYYWRVGIMMPNSSEVSVWSEEWYFITGPAGGTYPETPTLISPAPNSTTSTNSVTFMWSAVSGAKQYEVELHNKDNDHWCGYTVTGTQVSWERSSGSFCLNYNSGNYEWTVTALNDYAWGTPSATWNFSTSALLSSQANGPTHDTPKYWMDSGGKKLYFEP